MNAESTPAPARTWSPQQEAVFAWFSGGFGNLVVRARAGTGKTTTIIEGVERAPESSVLVCAFNKRIADELSARLRNPRATASTLHSAGRRVLLRYWSNIRTKDDNRRARGLAVAAVGEDAPDPMVALVAKLCTLGRECAPLATRARDLLALAEAHDLLPSGEWEEDGWDDRRVCEGAFRAMELAARRPADGVIDFADMLYLPIRLRIVRPTYDLVVVDEAQDMNAAQLLLAVGLSRGRVCVVGDDRQAIYGFRGADSGSVDRLKTELKAVELGLTVTYRCGKAIVADAARYVPDFSAAPTSPDGIVRSLAIEKVEDEVTIGDAILSRLNAPLVSRCLALLRRGVPARVEGRDVAAKLRSLVRELATGSARDSIPVLLSRLAAWERKETDRATRRTSDPEVASARCEAISDEAAAVRALAEGVSGVRELETRIAKVFDEVAVGRAVVLSSIHRAKGLEWTRVYVLADTLRPGKNREEDNLCYVAATRAKAELVYVS